MTAQQNIKSRSDARSISYSRVKVYLIIKRLVDIVASILLLLLLTPIIIFISYCIHKEKAGPILSRQLHSGKNNRPFMMCTFRTMTSPSQVIRELPPLPILDLWENGIPNEFTPNMNGHTTITPIGKILQRYGLHKIPQFVHVLKGEMSLIGPKAEVPMITKYYDDYEILRLNIKPGMTGYAQIDNHTNEVKKVSLDLYYLRHCSGSLDLKIVFQTFLNMVKAKKAN